MPPSSGESGSVVSIGGYTLAERLGSGGMGVVHLAHSPSGRQVAVKVVHAQYAQDEEFRARFRQEVQAARRVSGAFTAPVVDADPDAEVPWMATLYVPGPTLSEVVAGQGPLGGRELRVLALGLTEALKDIHRAGVVHRDLKPSNVLMAEDGPRVIDFGISRAADNQTLTITGRLMGTPPFMSPEQFTSPREVTAASDVFSLGSLLVYAATGTRPFDGESPYLTVYQVMHEEPSLDGVTEPLRSMVERCLIKDPEERPQLAELQRLFKTLPDTAPAVPTPPPSGDHTEPEGIPYDAPTQAVVASPRRRLSILKRRPAVRRRLRPGLPRLGGRRLPRRLLTAAAVGVVGIVAVMWNLGVDSNSSSGSSDVVDTPVLSLPEGWSPWRTNLTRAVSAADQDRLSSHDRPGCVPDKAAVYCTGSGFTVARMDAGTGRVTWRFGVSPQSARPLGVRDGFVYVYENPPVESSGDVIEWQLVALDAKTGERRWTRSVDATQPAVLFDGGVLALSTDHSQLIGIDAKSGKDLWRSSTKSSAGTRCTPLVLHGSPYGLCSNQDDPASGDWSLLQLGEDGSRELATLPTAVVPLGDLAGKPLFVQSKDAEQQSLGGLDEAYTTFLRVDPASGAVTRTRLSQTIRGTATLVGSTVYFVRPDGTVSAVATGTGELVWQSDTQVENLSKPVWSRTFGSLFLVNRYGRLLSLEVSTGNVMWTTDKLQDPAGAPENVVPTLTLVGDAIVAVTGDTAFSVSPDTPDLGPETVSADSLAS
ncbi:protein kinase domain-containing protein [Streptomyces acidiscabies]|uniref:serine/threonine-protein kinase n=1 Tax=Streptomyces acidiscabies TaxID=42234 RepID=UPI00073F4B3A|nr:serine/threonine-protein kinase [Streptomyces acidiscabies]GAQ55789.1 serine/threonine-protein kinase AfsK [Streptomyces acidiscabies]GAV42823.1 serine/threonine-protein kinase AfsK [Streptomyces acidiscabies]